MVKLEIKTEAEVDLDEIYDYSVTVFGHRVAVEYMDGLRRSFERLLDNPLIGSRVFDDQDMYRSLSHRSHRIYYAFDGKTVLIVRIFHKSRDASNLLQ